MRRITRSEERILFPAWLEDNGRNCISVIVDDLSNPFATSQLHNEGRRGGLLRSWNW